MTTKELTKEAIVIPAPAVDAEYEALAAKLGVGIPAPDTSMLDRLDGILAALSITKYGTAAVEKYLLEQKPAGHDYVWVSAVPQFVPSALLRLRPRYRANGWMRKSVDGGIIAGQVYNKPIPYAVLVTMDSIRTEALKSGIIPTFFVSDFAKARSFTVSRIDPFLAVGSSHSTAFHIIERWDEPGFREEVYSKKKTVKKAR